jgi:excisionase family DNA binding protein
LELQEAARYLGVSPWTVRDLEAAGTIKRVRVPLAGGRELRKLLFDKSELDRLIDVWKAA